MNHRSLQDPRGTLWFVGLSIVLVVCTIVFWFLLLRDSSVRLLDQTLRHETLEMEGLFRVYTIDHIPPESITRKITLHMFSDPWKMYFVEIRSNEGVNLVRAGLLDTSVSLCQTGCLSSKTPITAIVGDGTLCRVYGQTFDGFAICVAAPMPTSWQLLEESFSSLAFVVPALVLLLATIGIWSFLRLHQPILRLDRYLQTLIQQPIGKELLKPPLPPKGDVYQLTQTVSKIVERLHASRNQALQFSSFASHELRTPLSIIRNQLESALAAHIQAKELRGVVASAYDEMLRLSRAVEDLLSLGTMQAGTLTLNIETISLTKFLTRFYDEALFLSRPKNITVVLKKGPEVYLKGDVIRLRQVFFNLLDNAIKNMSSGKRIRLSYSIKNGFVVIVFADTGIGIAPDKLERIFEPFFTFRQAGGSYQGSGLGLALVRWIIELHRGSISVTSQVGIGTEFIISLPFERVIEVI